MVAEAITTMFIGLAGGLAVGSGFVAFLTVLGIIPRLTQLSKTGHLLIHYEGSVIIGAQVGTWFSLYKPTFALSPLLLIPIGLFAGMFVGMLAAALTEVLNVLPIMAKRVGVENRLIYLLMAIALGKVCGSLYHWVFFVK
ncbi:stage V sporulation protein AB [Halalkalibacterium ligniniphilum]|uniref:stage V sporulation protein AB n=1 Tax=Halalkalibacterium ligniniphilum TaxID=1134413 RepID=UPI0003469FD5|nr:stage V sporulation protein AB [Halalkalibacterium ligniniphilum]